MKYCILTNVYNELGNLEPIFKEVLKQTIKPTRWLFIDDGSIDGTSEELELLSDKYSNLPLFIVHLPKKKRGNLDTLGITLKKGIMCLKKEHPSENYDYYAKLDVDTRLPPNYYEKIHEYFQKDPRLLVASGTIISNGREEFNRRKFARGSGLVVRAWFLDKYWSLIPDVTIDTWVSARARMLGFKSLQIPDLKLIQTKPTTQLTSKGITRNGRLMYYFDYHFTVILFKMFWLLFMRCQNGFLLLKGYLDARNKGWKIKDPLVRYYFQVKIFLDYMEQLFKRIARIF